MHEGSTAVKHQADGEAKVKAGDGEASVVEVMRFTREEVQRGDATGWRFSAGWFRKVSGLEWAWFDRDIDE